MTHDSTPLRVFRISELTRIIASQLILTSRESAVNFACTRRCLEEPVLSTLWETQKSLPILLRMLPKTTWYVDNLGRDCTLGIAGDPSPEAWNRVRRYASWMRQVHLDEWWALGEETFLKLRLNSPPGGWFPAAQESLDWCITKSNLHYADIFFSPRLKNTSIFISPLWARRAIFLDAIPAITSTISALPISTPQNLRVSPTASWLDLKESFSPIVLHCGPSLIEFVSKIPLSDAAINHLIRLRHLRTCHIRSPPPNYSASSLPPVFPPLTEFAVEEDGVREWVLLLERLAGHVTPLSKVKESSRSLNLPSPTIDASFSSLIQSFRNMVNLKIEVVCRGRGSEAQCIFKLNNDDVTKLAMALSQLESLLLGRPCSNNTCATTVACLLQISVHCAELQVLRIHFNTTNIVDDLKNISDDPRFQDLHPLPRCMLAHLDIHEMTLNLDEPDFETVATGMISIFPFFEYFKGTEGNLDWEEISKRIMELQKIHVSWMDE